ncbi:MAG TPA: hypothetical protein VIM65_16195 [Cyclobacteriaceae bacterium]
MAKAAAKTSTSSTKKVASKPKAASSSVDSIQKVSEETLKKLQSLSIDPKLQADIEWCLGSYAHDKNPVGLIEMLERSLTVFKNEQAKKTKGVTAKLIGDLEKALVNK